MRMVMIGVVAVVAAVAADADTAGAKRRAGPPTWCNQGNAVTGGVMECSYYSLAQCLASASGVGGGCIPNPAFEWAKRYPPRGHGWRY